MSRKTLFLLIVACLVLTAAATSQELQSGSIRGKVTDDTGQPLPGVSITISGPALIGKVTAVTNAEGMFRAPP
ncbi:MAG: carboxypeptidase-like regulatory domain-containing protein [Candidatus Moduliflexus flocculans]|nr:carboxypeptidase-like regulatory domain-containing protein [Candidatus Moduliflexus flocculans]